MKLYDVEGYDTPLMLSEEHAEIIGATEHEIVDEKPTRNAPKQAWADYALSQGADPAGVEQMTRAQLVDTWG